MLEISNNILVKCPLPSSKWLGVAAILNSKCCPKLKEKFQNIASHILHGDIMDAAQRKTSGNI